jgi:excinuclease ABC subunit C
MLGKLQSRLALKKLPRRIECFDIAHIQGASTVASMVTFVDGQPDKSRYRKFKIKTVTNDDFASMYEVLSRRFKRARDAEQGDPWSVPDLLVIDGGKGQLGKAVAAMEDLGIRLRGPGGFDVVALAKEREDAGGNAQPDRVFRVGLKDPVLLRPNTTEMFLLARVRDEAHRFANTFHRERRRKMTLRSALDDIPGIGAKRRKALLRHFGSVKAIRAATVDQLAAAPSMGRASAEAVRSFFDDSAG